MSSLICTTPMCAQGKASMDEMRRTFNVLSGSNSFDRPRFESAVIALEETFEDEYSMFSEWIPFNPACCAMKDLGNQADQLTRTMLASAGVADVGGGPASSAAAIDLNMVIMVGVGLLALSAAGSLKHAFK